MAHIYDSGKDNFPKMPIPTEITHIIEKLAAHFATTAHAVKITPIRHGVIERNNVWRLDIAGNTYLLKQHLNTQQIGGARFTPFQIESAVTSTLYQAGCRVPKIVWESESDAFRLLEWGGDTTLDALGQEATLETLKPVTLEAVREFCGLERAFADYADTIAPYIFEPEPPNTLPETLQTLLEQGRKTLHYLAQLSGLDDETAIDTVWSTLSARLHAATPTLGHLDYNARNVVIHRNTPTFIDFTSVGWDWGERRLVQTFNSLGAHHRGGNFVSLLDPEIVEIYANETVSRDTPSEIAVRVDAHYLLFYLVAIYRLVQAVAQPDTSESQQLVSAWGNTKLRFRRAIDLLVDSPLSDDLYANQIRAWIGAFRTSEGCPNGLDFSNSRQDSG